MYTYILCISLLYNIILYYSVLYTNHIISMSMPGVPCHGAIQRWLHQLLCTCNTYSIYNMLNIVTGPKPKMKA